MTKTFTSLDKDAAIERNYGGHKEEQGEPASFCYYPAPAANAEDLQGIPKMSLKRNMNYLLLSLGLISPHIQAQADKGKGELLSKYTRMYIAMAAISIHEDPNRASRYQSLSLRFLDRVAMLIGSKEIDRIASIELKRIKKALAINDPL